MRGGHLILLLVVILLLFLWLRRRARLGRSFHLPRLGRGRLTTVTVDVGGRPRTAQVQPGDSRGGPLLLCFHGGLGRIDRFVRSSGLAARGTARGFTVAFPHAPDGWVDGRPERGDSTEDLDFMAGLIDRLARENGIDRSQVYALGVSNGGMFAQRLATERPELLAGAASIIASIPVAIAPQLAEGPPLPFVLVCDVNDQIMPWSGGAIRRGRTVGVGGRVVPAEEARDIWIHRNRVVQGLRPVHIEGPSGHGADIHDYPPGSGGAPFRFIAVSAGGHSWPRWPAHRGVTGFDAGDSVIEFFDRVRRGQATAEGGRAGGPDIAQRRARP